MKDYLLQQIELTNNNESLFFENYALKIALKLLQDKGLNELKKSINLALNDRLLSSQQKNFFIELNSKI